MIQRTDNATLILLNHFNGIRVKLLFDMVSKLEEKEKLHRIAALQQMSSRPVVPPTILKLKDIRI